MIRTIRAAMAAMLLLACQASPALAADVKPLVNAAGQVRPAHAGETVGVANGGTGATSLTAHCVYIGAGTSAAHFACPSSSGQVLTDNGASSDPTFQAIVGLSAIANNNLLANTSGSSAVPIATPFASITGVGSALKWTTGRTLSITGDLSYTSPSFDGTGNVTAAGTLATTGVSAGTCGDATHVCQVTFDAKGRATSTTSVALTGGGGSGVGGSIVTPQGRLTLTSNTPIMAADATAQTSVYYTPYLGNQIPIYDGSNFANYTFSQLTLSLDATNHLANGVYDVFIWNDAGTIKVGAGPVWTKASTVTITIATPAVVSWTGHGLIESASVVFTTSGALPTGITAGTTYYVGRSPGANSFNISTSVANAAAGTFVATSGSQSGTHTATNNNQARGTGAGTTELQMLNGVWTNNNAVTVTNGAGAGTSVPANRATYVGSFFATANGQTGMSFIPAAAAGGAGPVLALYNGYNRVGVRATSRDSTSTWSKTGTNWAPADNNSNNRAIFLDGLQQSRISATWMVNGNAAPGGPITGINLDSTIAAPQITTQINSTSLLPSEVADQWQPQLGFHYVQAMEASTSASAATFFGAQTSPTRQLNALIVELEM